MLYFLKFSNIGTFDAVSLLYKYKTPRNAKANALAPLLWKNVFWFPQLISPSPGSGGGGVEAPLYLLLGRSKRLGRGLMHPWSLVKRTFH